MTIVVSTPSTALPVTVARVIDTSTVVDMAPLRESHEATQLEAELKALFISMFEQFARPQERETNTAGTPHIGPFGQVERAVKAEGLSLFRKSDDGAMRYLFRSWRARNPKRGLHMLQTYLQLLWPNEWTIDQMWQSKSATYPLALQEIDSGNHYLTSRVSVYISSAVTDGADVLRLGPSLRSVIPARIFLKVGVSQKAAAGVAAASAMYAGLTVQRFTGTFDQPLGIQAAQAAYRGATIEQFSGAFA